MEPEGRDPAKLVKACRELHAMPQALTDTHAHAFFSEFPLERIFRALAGTHDRADISILSDTLGRLLATELGSSMLPNALPYLAAASSTPVPRLRRLAAEQYGSLLMTRVRRRRSLAPLSGGDGGGGSGDGGGRDDDDGGVTESACMQLVRMLSDPDTAVASTAAKALRTYGSSSLGALQRLLSPGSALSAALAAAAAADELGGVVRLRVLALALELAAGGDESRPLANGYHQPQQPSAATDTSSSSSLSSSGAAAAPSTAPYQYGERLQLLRDSGLLQPLLDQLSGPSDALACLAALQLLDDLLAAAAADGGGGGGAADGGAVVGGGMAAALASVALPQLLALVSEPTLTDAALPLVAGILHRSLPAAPPTAALAAALSAAANGGTAPSSPAGASSGPAAAELQPALTAAPALLAAVHAVLDDRGDASAAAEASGLDALGTLGQSAAGAVMVVSDERLVRAMCERALGRSPHPEVRIAALHSAASTAGLERAGGQRDRTAAFLPVQCEEALRRGVYGACGVRRPGEVLAGMLQQPFLELRLAAYRCIAALSLRSWFAVEVVTTPDLYDRITDARSDSGAAACNWRHAAAAALWATVSTAAAAAVAVGGEAAAAAAAGPGEAVFAATLAAPETVDRVRVAVRGGPYGTEGGGAAVAAAAAAAASRMHEEHFVASRGAGGGA